MFVRFIMLCEAIINSFPLLCSIPVYEYSVETVLVVQSCLTLCNPMDCSQRAPLSIEFSRQEYWSGLTCPSPGTLPDPGMEPRSPPRQTDSLPSEPPGKPICHIIYPTVDGHLSYFQFGGCY